MKARKTVLISALSAVALAGIGVGATFALFTDKAEAQISANAGIVQIASKVGLVSYSDGDDLTNEDKALTELDAYTTETNTVITLVDDATISIENMIPGDEIKVSVGLKNLSTVKAKYRVRLVMTGELAPALETDFGGEIAGWRTIDPATPAEIAAGGKVIEGTDVTISFPNHGFEITPASEGIDNAYQGKSAQIKIFAEAVQGNAVTDDRLVVASRAKTADKDGVNLLYNPVTEVYSYGVTEDMLADDFAEGINLRYKEDENGFVKDEFGYIALKTAGGVDINAAASANKTVYLPFGIIDEAALNGDVDPNSASSSYLTFSGHNFDNVVFDGALGIDEAGKDVLETVIDTKGFAYRRSTSASAVQFQNVDGVVLNDLIFQDTGEVFESLKEGMNSKTFLFFQDADVTLNDCVIDAEEFELNAITRAAIDLRQGADVKLNNSVIKSYANGSYGWTVDVGGNPVDLPVGACLQTVISVNSYDATATDNVIKFKMEGGKVIYATAEQDYVYINVPGVPAALDDIPLIDMGNLPESVKNKLVGFYQTHGADDALDLDESEILFKGVQIDGRASSTFGAGNVVGNPANPDHINIVDFQ